jgi:hypothetical protein
MATVIAMLAAGCPMAWAQTTEEAVGAEASLAKQLQNPIANLISVPFQNNFDYGGGVQGTWLTIHSQHPTGHSLHDHCRLELDRPHHRPNH